jgi:magnesium-transporting ATPase (P-type)
LTAFPIIWFAIFDWEHDKKTFLSNPNLYKIGMHDVFFNYLEFTRWFFYAVWQGILIMFLVLYTFEVGTIRNGQLSGLVLEGNYVYYAIIVVVNIKVLISSFQYTWWMMFWIFGSIILYYLFLVMFTYIKIDPLYGVMQY